MLVLITSCGRHDLLIQTIRTFLHKNPYQCKIIIHEDGLEGMPIDVKPFMPVDTEVIRTNGVGQSHSITKFLLSDRFRKEKYYIHLEDDFLFENSYDWISDSISIMETDPDIIKVLACKTTPHPCEHSKSLVLTDHNGRRTVDFGEVKPWSNNGITWRGFSYNPGVTRLDLLRQFAPLPQFEQDLAEHIYQAGLKVAELKNKIYEHIGEGRSTHA